MANLHNVYDDDAYFVVNIATRTVSNGAGGKVTLVQGDHNSERMTFKIPRLVEGHDMSLCSKIEVHYINISADEKEKSEDVYLVEDAETQDNDVVFSWLISGNATKYAGTLSFLIRFTCLTGTEIDYVWNTAIFSGITVASGMNNGEAVIAEYSDVLEAWKREICVDFDERLNGAENVTQAIENALAGAKASGDFDGKSAYAYAQDGGYDGTETEFAEDINPDNINANANSFIATELAKRGQLKPEFANSVEECTDTTKLYVLPDGYIYAYMLTEKEVGIAPTVGILPDAAMGSDQATGWVEGEGYTVNARLSGSGGNAVTGYTDIAGVCVSGYIPVKIGDIVRIKNFYGPNGISTYAVSYDNSKARLANKSWGVANADTNYEWGEGKYGVGDWYTVEGEKKPTGITTFTVTEANFGADVAYIRFSGFFNFDGKKTIVTINEEIVEGGTEIVTEYDWANTGFAFVPADYEGRILDLENEMEQNAEDIENLKKGLTNVTDITEWDSPIYDANIPVFELSSEKAAMTNAAMTPNDIYAMYDALMEKHPNYITKTDLGLCSDGMNHVYRYDFKEPEPRHTSGYDWSETKAKAIIVSGIHYEWSGIYGLYYALEEIADNPELRNLRRNTHLIVVPCMNPYATIADNYSDSVGVRNANGVEIHRNFEVGWVQTEEGTTHYGGSAPLSEVETQYVDNIMKENTDAAFFLTCHNFGDTSFNFIWPSAATPYMCNMGYRLIDKLSNVWMDKYGDEFVGLEDYRTEDIPSWDNRLGFAHISMTPGTETRQATKYGIQGVNVEINGRFWVHGTEASPEPSMSSFTMSRGAEVYVNFLLTAFGVYDPMDKALYGEQ